jgi:hypothetical protein
MKNYQGYVKINSVKRGGEEECEQIVDISFSAAPENKWGILHSRAVSEMKPLDTGKTYKHYHFLKEV